MLVKTFGGRVILLLAVLGLAVCINAISEAINYTQGPGYVAGAGAYIGDGPVVDTIRPFPGRGITTDAGSTIVDADWGLDFSAGKLICLVSELDDSFATLHSTQTISGAKTFTAAAGVQIGADGQDGKVSIFSEQGDPDYTIVFQPHAAMTQTTTYTWPANDGDADQYMKTDGSGNLSWATPSGVGTQDTAWFWNDAGDEAHGTPSNAVHLKWGNGIDATWDVNDTVITASVDESELVLSSMGGAVTDDQVPNDITINEASDVDTTGTKIAAALGNRLDANGTDNVSVQHLDDGADTPSDEDVLTYEVTGTELEWHSRSEWMTGWLGSTDITTLGTIGTGVWNATALTDDYVANDITVNEASDVDTTGTKIAAALGNRASLSDIKDSTWIVDCWSPRNFDIDTVSDLEAVHIKYPLTIRGTPTHMNVVRFLNVSGLADQMGAVSFSGMLPGGFKADVDSFVFGFCTTDTDTLITKLNVAIYAMNDQSGWPPDDTVKFSGNSYASTVADTWRWVTIAAGSIGPIAALSTVWINIEATLDDGEMVMVEGPDRMRFGASRK